MAKKKAKKTAKKAAASAKKFGVSHLAKHMGIKEATARIKLRAGKVKKAGKGYGWDSSSEMEAVAKKLAA